MTEQRCSPSWERMLRPDEANLEFFARRTELPGVALFHAERPDAPEFDLALIYRVPEAAAEATLREIVRHYRQLGRRPCVWLSPCSAPARWPELLARAGFRETNTRLVHYSIPATAWLTVNPAVRVSRVRSAEDADRYSAIQAVGFALSPDHAEWDRQLARRHLAEDRYRFYLAWLDDRAVGAGRCIHLPSSVTTIGALAVLPEARSIGVGATVRTRMVADARRAGSDTICGTVRPGRHLAEIHARLGFVRHFATRTFAGPAWPVPEGANADSWNRWRRPPASADHPLTGWRGARR